MLFCTLTQHQPLNSPFHFHVYTQIEADTLYLVHINPGNQDQEFSTIIYPMSLSCGARAVNKRDSDCEHVFCGHSGAGICERRDFMPVCKMKLKVTLL